MNAREPRPSAGMRRATGRDRGEWFAVLDRWGAAGRPYREIADWLVAEHQLSKWWAQKLIVEYEEARGLRDPGIRRDGTFEVGASKTVAVPVDRLLAAFADARLRERWLPGVEIPRAASPLRFDWKDGASRVVVTVTGVGPARSQVSVQHQRLSDAKAAAEMKAFWRERLTDLKALLEGEPAGEDAEPSRILPESSARGGIGHDVTPRALRSAVAGRFRGRIWSPAGDSATKLDIVADTATRWRIHGESP